MPIHRHSSLRADLAALLTERLSRTRRYLRIAGYFRRLRHRGKRTAGAVISSVPMREHGNANGIDA